MMRKNILALVALSLAVSIPASAIAQVRDLGDIASDIAIQTRFVSQLITVIAFVLGVGLAISGLLKFKAHSQNPNDPSAKISTAFVLVFVGAAMVALPATLGSGISTIFGANADRTNPTSGFDSIR